MVLKICINIVQEQAILVTILFVKKQRLAIYHLDAQHADK